jgi:hypothetical protein
MHAQTVSAALRQLDRSRAHADPLDRIADEQARHCEAVEGMFASFLKSKGSGVEGCDEHDARTLAAVALTRIIERTTPAALLEVLTPFDPLLRS